MYNSFQYWSFVWFLFLTFSTFYILLFLHCLQCLFYPKHKPFKICICLVGFIVKNPPAMQEMQVRSLVGEDNLEKEMATCCSILALEILLTEEPGGLQSIDVTKSRTRLGTRAQTHIADICHPQSSDYSVYYSGLCFYIVIFYLMIFYFILFYFVIFAPFSMVSFWSLGLNYFSLEGICIWFFQV